MNLINFEPWEDDKESNLLELKILWPIFLILTGFAFITQTFIPTLYAIIAFIAVMFLTLESMGAKGPLVPPILGFGKQNRIAIYVVVGIGLGLLFIIPSFFPSTHSFSLKSLVTTQEASLIQMFFQNAGLFIDISTVTFWTQFFYQVITAGVIEEVFFRGLAVPLLTWLFKNWRVGVGLSNLFFAFYHLFIYGANPAQVFGAFFFGVVITLVNYKSGSILPSTIAHMMNNTVFGGFIKIAGVVTK